MKGVENGMFGLIYIRKMKYNSDTESEDCEVTPTLSFG